MVFAAAGRILGGRVPVTPAMMMLQCFASMTPEMVRMQGGASCRIRTSGCIGGGARAGQDTSRRRLISHVPSLFMGAFGAPANLAGRARCLSTMRSSNGGPGRDPVGFEDEGGGDRGVAQMQSSGKKAEDLHVPVLLDQVLSVFEGRKLGVFVDGTLGMAGHSCAVYKQQQESITRLIGIDQDPIAMEHARKRLAESGCEQVTLLRGNFGSMRKLLVDAGIKAGSVDGILLDVGTSSMQLDDASRGFSFMRDGPLDMRMDPQGTLTAADICNNWSEEDIAKVIFEFGEEPKSRSIAKKIVAAREIKPITTTLELSDILGGNRPKIFIKGRKAGLHPATLTFQALRIAVNRELNVRHNAIPPLAKKTQSIWSEPTPLPWQVLATAIPQAFELLAPGGRLAVISFHSLEDRIVKWAFREAEGAQEGRKHKNKYAKDDEDSLAPGSVR